MVVPRTWCGIASVPCDGVQSFWFYLPYGFNPILLSILWPIDTKKVVFIGGRVDSGILFQTNKNTQQISKTFQNI